MQKLLSIPYSSVPSSSLEMGLELDQEDERRRVDLLLDLVEINFVEVVELIAQVMEGGLMVKKLLAFGKEDWLQLRVVEVPRIELPRE